jgi:outer membrane protein OmpA-like peptidoglycan-associated protein
VSIGRPAVALRLMSLALACSLQVWAPEAAAQSGAAPQPDDMINALRPSRQRNLQVRPTTAAESAAAAASASATPAPAAAPTAAMTPAATAPAPMPVTSPTPAPPPSLSLAIPFEVNSARLRPESGPLLGNLVAALLSADLKGQRFVIEGHTDASGNPATNQRLSQARAEEVRLYLVALGVHPSRLRAVGKGSGEPANVLDPLSADNRRVRVVTIE